MFVVGLTGGIASGKTTITDFLRTHGALVIDADKVGHEVLTLEEVKRELAEAFGADVIGPDGTVDRKRLGGLVFGNPDNLAKLNSISHPRLRRLSFERIEQIRLDGKAQVVVLDAAILLEAGWDALCDEVWVVYVPEQVAADRLMARNGLTAEQAWARISSQMPVEEKRRQADVVIDNNRPLADVGLSIDREWSKLVDRVQGASPRLRRPAPGLRAP